MKTIFSILLCTSLGFGHPAIINLPADTWYSVPNTHMTDVMDTKFGPSNKIVSAWSGGAYDPNGKRLLIWGGGLGNYRGNEIYAFNVETLQWERLNDPYPDPVCQDPQPDGSAVVRHTYNCLAFITHANRFFAHGGAFNCQGRACSMNITWTFDMASRKWVQMVPDGPFNTCASSCTYDPLTGKVYYCAASVGFFSYDYNSNTWARIGTNKGVSNRTGVIDTKRRIWLLVGRGSVEVFNLKNNDQSPSTWTTTGGSAVVDANGPGLAYDPVSDHAVAWAGGSVYSLNMDTKQWIQHSSAGAPQPTETGIYGRWQYCPSVNAFICVTGTGENVHFYKFTQGGSAIEVQAKSRPDNMIDNSILDMYPNPFYTAVVISVADRRGGVLTNDGHNLMNTTPTTPPQYIAIYNIHGRMVDRISLSVSQKVTWHPQGIPNGIYIIKAEIGKKIYTEKIIFAK